MEEGEREERGQERAGANRRGGKRANKNQKKGRERARGPSLPPIASRVREERPNNEALPFHRQQQGEHQMLENKHLGAKKIYNPSKLSRLSQPSQTSPTVVLRTVDGPHQSVRIRCKSKYGVIGGKSGKKKQPQR
jgi:hypothetical protein